MNSKGKKRMELKGVTKALVCNSISMIIENLNIEKYKIILIKMFKPNNIYYMKRMGILISSLVITMTEKSCHIN